MGKLKLSLLSFSEVAVRGFQEDVQNLQYIHTYIHTYGQAETNILPTFSKLGA